MVPRDRSPRYDHRNCQSLFGYAAAVHARSGGRCMLCQSGSAPPDFDSWRQLTVEHLIGRSQGGHLEVIRRALIDSQIELETAEREKLALRIDAMNTISACHFCNSTTSRDRHTRNLDSILREHTGDPEVLVRTLSTELEEVLSKKRERVQWKLRSVREAFEREVLPRLSDRGPI